MIEEEIRIRDRFQFEIKLNYRLNQDKPKTQYQIDAYIFIPQSLRVNHTTYPKNTFYQDLQSYIRFKTPSLSLSDIACKDNGPLFDLEESISGLTENSRSDVTSEVELRVKLFSCITKSALRDTVQFIHNTVDEQDRERMIREYSDSVSKITSGYRDLGARLLQPTVSENAHAVYAFGDEYLSLMTEGHSYRLLEILKQSASLSVKKLKTDLINIISNEIAYRKRRGYPSIPTAGSDNEQLIFRRNVLKKFTDNVLFLDASRHPTGQALEQSLFGLAAGVSMFFATMVHFYSQSVYGALSLPVFLALVIGYIFKDRIKELMRIYFSRKVLSALFDHKTNIYRGQKNKIGYCRESFNFLDEEKIPKQVMRIRARDHMTEIESEWLREDVVLYRKRTGLFSKAVREAYPGLEISGVNDIMRFNINAFVQRSGDPRKDLFVLEGGDYRKIKGERVYHLNMIVKYGGSAQSHFKRFRIVLNRRKIKRIEAVSVEEEL